MVHSLQLFLSSLFRFIKLGMDRLRAYRFQLWGATLGRKCLIGRGCRVDNPWTVSFGSRVTLEPDVWIKVVDSTASVQIGDQTFLGRGVEIDALHSVKIGTNVLIAPHVFITDHHHNIKKESMIVQQGCSSAAVQIGNDVWIGTGVTILPGVSIDHGAVIGAGAVVTKDVPAYEIWAGVPAEKIGMRE